MPTGAVGNIGVIRGLLLGALNAPLDFADIIQIIGDAGAVVRAQIVIQVAHFLRDRIQDAAVFLHAAHPVGRRAAVAEQVLENHTRVDFHGQRRGGRAPA